MPRQVLDIFLSSTSEDLREHRNTVAGILSRLGHFTIRMESFGAQPNRPLEVCREGVQRCDALIVLVGHRYGWVPTKADGGDGKRSITWHEVQWALDSDRPVYAFLVDQEAPWSGPREQDRLVGATSQAQSLEVWRAVRGLREFRSFLDTHTTRELFRTAEHLGSLVATSLFPWLLETASPVRASSEADRAPAAGVPVDRPPEMGSAPSELVHELLYWQELIHVRSARQVLGDRPPVRVAIIAGRPHETHPSLANVDITPVALEGGVPASDGYTTALAALISGSGDDGFEGVAPGTPLLAISVLDEKYSSTNAAIAAGVDRAVLGGARVICLSLGGVEPSKTVEDAIADAERAGVLVVAAAGNNGGQAPSYPAASPGVLAVGAIDRHGGLMPWTNRGDWVHVMAPGYQMMLPAGASGYAPWQGTSWSCAIASGAAALLLQADPGLTPAEARDVLVKTGVVRDGDVGRVIDVHSAVNLVTVMAKTRS